jgi:GAF domain-containing protein
MTASWTPFDAAGLTAALAQAAQPAEVYRAVQQVLAAHIGFSLFTLLVRTPDGQQVQRVYTTNADAYPVAGLKRMGPTPWGDLVLTRRQSFLGRDAEAIRWAFPDHALIASLGLASVVNVPVVALGRVLGTFNVLDAEGRYSEDDVRMVEAIAPVLVAPFLRELGLF